MTDREFAALVEVAAAPLPAKRAVCLALRTREAARRSGVPIPAEQRRAAPAGVLFDLGCGQGVLMALLRSASARYARGDWPAEWPAPPSSLKLHGVELSRRRAEVAGQALDGGAVVERGDIRHASLPTCAAIVILDVLLYLDDADQRRVLARCAAALGPGGVLVLREADASAGLPFHVTRWAEKLACWSRGQLRQPLWYRPAREWQALLEASGFTVEAQPMSEGTPFGNVLFVALRR